MARKSKLRILCGRKVPKGELEAIRNKKVYGKEPSTLAQRAAERAEAARRAESVDRRNRMAGKLRVSLVGLDPSDGLEAVIDSAELQKSMGDVSLFCDEVSQVASDAIGFKVESVGPDGVEEIVGSDVTWDRVDEDVEVARYEHPSVNEVLDAVGAYIAGTGLPDVDRLRERFGFSFPMPADESPVDLQGKQMAKRVLSALEDYEGTDRAEVLADAADLIGMHGISTNEVRFLVESLNATAPGEKYAVVTRLQRYDKVDELGPDGISCIGKLRDVDPLPSDGDAFGIYEGAAPSGDGDGIEIGG